MDIDITQFLKNIISDIIEMDDKQIYALLISLIPTDKLELLSARIQTLNNEISNELYQRNDTISSIDMSKIDEKEIRVVGDNIYNYESQILYEFKRYGNSVAHIINANTIKIVYDKSTDANNAMQHKNSIMYAINKLIISGW